MRTIPMQLTFSDLSEQNKKVTTKKAKFLAQMDQIIPWQKFISAVKPYYHKEYNPKGGSKPYPLETMLRIYFVQQWYNLSDVGAEEFIYDISTVRAFTRVQLERVPDETTILNFRRILERHKLSEKFLQISHDYLEQKGLKVSKGTIMDATIIQAPSSTKNISKKRDPEMASTRKNGQYFFGLKTHIGTDINTNVIHSVVITAANESDVRQMPELLRKNDEVIMGDAGYTGDKHKKLAREQGKLFMVNDKRKPKHTKNKKKNLSTTQKKRNRKISQVRAKVEHCFRVLKRQFGYNKTRYKGLEKNRIQILSLLSLVNLYSNREMLMKC